MIIITIIIIIIITETEHCCKNLMKGTNTLTVSLVR